MALSVTSLNSGSNGNCYYTANDTEAVLIDVGITCRETEKRLAILGLSMQKVRAIFISHEHGDHIRGLPAIAAKYSLPVYITSNTASVGCIRLNGGLARSFDPYEPVYVGGLAVTAFPKHHDAADPHSFIISCNGTTIGVFTDIGATCDRVIKYFSLCNAAFLEANYDEALLENGRYPYFLKNRIRGGKGHLSNRQALELFTKYRPAYMSHLFLAHLSKDNNCPKLAHELFSKQSNGIEIIVASRYEQTPLYVINATGNYQFTEKLPVHISQPTQLTLFG